MREKKQIYCNGCGKKIAEDAENLNVDFLHVEKIWGYFSDKDQERHSFDLCEACYDKMIRQFVREVAVTEETELL